MIYRYAHPEYFKNSGKPDLKLLDGNLVLWGAGRIGGMAAHCLKRLGVNIRAFCDIAQDKWGTDFCGCEVISPDELKRCYSQATVLISSIFYRTISESLHNMGYKNIFDCSSLFMEIDFTGYDFWMEPEYAIRNVEQYLEALASELSEVDIVDQIFLNITNRCSLNCRDCSVFIPRVITPRDYPAEDIIMDFRTLLRVIGRTRIANCYGGEPLLHPQLPKIISALSNERNFERISFITNGTLLPSRELLDVIKADERILVRVSDYGQLSKNLRPLLRMLDENAIKYEVANYSYWDRPSKIGYTNSTPEELRSKFLDCTSCNVVFIMNRRLYLCSTGSALCNIDVFPESANNYVDFRDERDLTSRIERFVHRRWNGEYLDACKYCSGNHCSQFENKMPVAVQAERSFVAGETGL